jgi:hypothetical protein
LINKYFRWHQTAAQSCRCLCNYPNDQKPHQPTNVPSVGQISHRQSRQSFSVAIPDLQNVQVPGTVSVASVAIPELQNLQVPGIVSVASVAIPELQNLQVPGIVSVASDAIPELKNLQVPAVASVAIPGMK